MDEQNYYQVKNNNLKDVSFTLQEYSFQITLRQQWNDKRLSFKNRIFGMEGKQDVSAKTFFFRFSPRSRHNSLSSAENVTGRDTLHGNSRLRPRHTVKFWKNFGQF